MTKQDQIQQDHLDVLLKHYISGHKRALAHLAMRYGKTKFTIDFLKEFFEEDGFPLILIAYPDNKLRDTWLSEMHKWNYDNPNVFLVNFASLWKYTEGVFDVFICDEVHELSENQLDSASLIMNKEKTIFLGLSGTISKDTQERLGIPIVVEYSTLDGIRDGILADYQITVHMVNLDNKIKTANKKGKLLTEQQKYNNYSFVIEKKKRNREDFMFLALARNRLSLASIGKINFLKKLLNEEFKNKRVIVFTGLAKVADSIGIPSYHSKSPSDKNFRDFQEGRINQLALAEMGKVGVTYPNLDAVILLNFTYNDAATSQTLNRAIKLDYRGKVADLRIICLKEEPEIKKLSSSLSMLDPSKIKYA